MTEAEITRFACLCDEEATAEGGQFGIGTYQEKRLHRVLKRFYSEDEAQTEVSVGSYVADVKRGSEIVEIQTGSFYPLVAKLRYYLEQTDCHVTLVHPIFAEHTILRMDKETGELLRQRKTSRAGRVTDLLPELYWIRELIPNDRLTVRLLLLRVEEYRYSERMRYRREGAYDAELFPKAILARVDFSTLDDYEALLPEAARFTAAEYEKQTRLAKRTAYRALRTLCDLGLLTRLTNGRKIVYQRA